MTKNIEQQQQQPTRTNKKSDPYRHLHKNQKGKTYSVKNKAAEASYRILTQPEEAGYLEAEGDMERTYSISQEKLLEMVPLQSSSKCINLKLDGAGGSHYDVDFTRSGKNMLIAGRGGHLASFEWQTGKLLSELNLENETIRSACYLQNESFFAVAQRRFTYIYDGLSGAEVHRLPKHTEVQHMQYLPYHFLLSTIGSQGMLRYQDVSTGIMSAEVQTMQGRCMAMKLNPTNGVMHLGHTGGLVTMWSPNQASPLVTMQCHAGPIQALAIDPCGRTMATSGLDGHIRIWDLRSYEKRLHEYNPVRPAIALDISQRGILAAGFGPHVTTWKDGLEQRAKTPYMSERLPSLLVGKVKFCPWDDVLAVGHTEGVRTLLIPGSGEPNYDSLVANPFASTSQRREAEVKQILEKLPLETITIDQKIIGKIAKSEDERKALALASQPIIEKPAKKAKTDAKSKNRLNGERVRRLKRKANIISAEKVKESSSGNNEDKEEKPYNALDRFKSKV